MSEVPLGVFLSGGLDSQHDCTYAHKAGMHPLKTFTIGFDRPEWDESADAQVIADHFQTEHHVLTLREQAMAHDLPQTIFNSHAILTSRLVIRRRCPPIIFPSWPTNM